MKRSVFILLCLISIRSAFCAEFAVVNKFPVAIKASVHYRLEDAADWLSTPFREILPGERAVLARSSHEAAYVHAYCESCPGIYWGKGDVWRPVDGSRIAYPMSENIGKDGDRIFDFILGNENTTGRRTGLYKTAYWDSSVEDALLYEALAGNRNYEIRPNCLIFDSRGEARGGGGSTFWVYAFENEKLKCVRFYAGFGSTEDLLAFFKKQSDLVSRGGRFQDERTKEYITFTSMDSLTIIHVFLPDGWMLTTFYHPDSLEAGFPDISQMDIDSYLDP